MASANATALNTGVEPMRWRDDPAQDKLYLARGDGTFRTSTSFNLNIAAPVRPVLRPLLAILVLAPALLAGPAQAQPPANPYDHERASSFTYQPNGLR